MSISPLPPPILVLVADLGVHDAVVDALLHSSHRVVTKWPDADSDPPGLILAEASQLPSAVPAGIGDLAPVILVGAATAAPQPDLALADHLRIPLSPSELICRVEAQLELRALRRALAEHQAMLDLAHERLAISESALRSNSLVDPLLGLWNGAAFDARLEEEKARALRHGATIALALVDLDRLASFNLAHGADAGDTVLQAVADITRRTTRGSDFLARYGGDEIAVLVPDGERTQALRLAERVRMAVYDADILHRPNRPWERVTVSIGVATCSLQCGGDAGIGIVACAERAVMQAKRAGRNCCSAAQCAFSGAQEIRQSESCLALTGTWG